ncbi:hypothetical protein CONLIGDRAFT_132485 [Coniochaeta ligniaria NRRL 30616]|uniref:Uncharacterized protein n=1 Tax=Coniochaeta ligniaria NRRL 30616 TaxID=1408157 RepID=A0A1J7I796_9PEZI|nr:hypothetical protein CONLIGDRAFT_132485 [Coniochaeta ligniaria NRRL 30616]
MPAVKLLHDSNVTLTPPSPTPHASAHQQRFAPQGTHIYFALATLALIFLVRFAVRRFSLHLPSWAQGPCQSERRKPEFPKDSKAYLWVSSAPASVSITSKPLFYRPGFEQGAQTVWEAGLLASPADQVRTGLSASAPGMEDQRDRTGSRGVSTSAAGSRHQVSLSLADPGSRESSRSPRSHNSRSSSRKQRNSSDGSARAQRKGKGLMDGDCWGGSLNQDTVVEHTFDRADGAMHSQDGESSDYEHGASASTPRFSRPVPPPPLTPPSLYTGVLTFEDRRPSYAVSIPAQLDTSFIHQPNPDYISSSTSAEYRHTVGPQSAASTPRRRSYTKSVPIGIPIPSGSSSSSSHQSQDMAWGVSSTDTFSPASYPPSSPQLPPPPPGSYDEVIYEQDGPQQDEIDLHGEIISVMDDAGHGWKRHTRVYGGGVCLACIAAGDREGGFYGDKVPLSERR